MEQPVGRQIPGDFNPPLRVLLCPDKADWAFDNIAASIEKNAGSNTVSKIYMQHVLGREHILFERIILKRIDICHIFWREDLFYLFTPTVIESASRALGFRPDELVRAVNNCAFTTSVYDHLFCEAEQIRQRQYDFALTDGYTVSSRRLHHIYASEPLVPDPDCIITDGVDTQRFFPRYAAQRVEENEDLPRSFNIGWAGNSAWGSQATGEDIKGYRRIFKPMLQLLARRGYPVQEKLADPQIKRIPFEAMPDFYRELDLFVCTSRIEGTPNPVLEAMACGVPVISTDVGVVGEAFGSLQQQFILREHDPAAFANAVQSLLDDAALRAELGRENVQSMQKWDWSTKCADWWPFWHGALRCATDARMAMRREALVLTRLGSYLQQRPAELQVTLD